jgi:hypothetical protein
MSAGGGKEIHFDSSSLRSQYDAGGAPQVDVTDPAYVPEIVTGAQPTPRQLAENIPPDVLKAMANGGRPSDESLRALAMGGAIIGANIPPVTIPNHFPLPRAASSTVELTIPVGNGVTARVTFSGQPARIHWRKLIRHLEIEAEDADETIAPPQPDLVALADAALQRQADAARPAPPKPSRRKRAASVDKNAVVEADDQKNRE